MIINDVCVLGGSGFVGVHVCNQLTERGYRVVPIAWARRAQERIPDCELRVFSECGHLPPREHSEELAGVVGRFLAS